MSTGVSMYLDVRQTAEMLDQVANSRGSTLAMTFVLPTASLDEPTVLRSRPPRRAWAGSGTPFVSLYAADDVVAVAAGRGLRTRGARWRTRLLVALLRGPLRRSTPSSGEDFLVVVTLP